MITRIQERFDERAIDLRDVFSRLWVERRWILASILVSTTAFTAAAFLMRPIYRATTVLIPANVGRGGLGAGLNSGLGELGGLATLVGVKLGGNAADTEEALAVMQSREFTEAFIRDRNLMPQLFSQHWDARTGRWQVSSQKQPTFAKGYKLFDTTVRSVVRDKKTGLVMLQIEWRDRQEAADWANDLVGRLNAEMRARAIRNAEASVRYLEKELQTATVVATREAISRLIEAQIKQRMFANVDLDYAFRVVDTAMPSDADDPVRPKKALMIVEGLTLGLGLGIAAVMLFRRTPASGPIARSEH